MRRYSIVATIFLGIDALLYLSPMTACGVNTAKFTDIGTGGSAGTGTTGAGGNSGTGTGAGTGGGISISGTATAGATTSTGSGGTTGGVCPAGLTCNVSCTGTSTTTIKGVVYDPAGKNVLPNVAVYVPATPLVPMDKGVPPAGSTDFCSCGALFKSGAITNTSTLIDGSFVLPNVPVPTTPGGKVNVVIQVGKWRKQIPVAVTACQVNQAPDMWLPSTVPAGDTITNMPDIAVSTGSADTLECLMRRIGLPDSEYVAGTGTSGHVHIFAGGEQSSSGNGNPGGGSHGMVGRPETPAMTGTSNFPSSTTLWANQNQLMPYDIVLLSCEGGETYGAQPAVLEEYLNAGGRAFASHFHYAWFSGPLGSGQSYKAPTDWGTNLATWSSDSSDGTGPVAGVIDTTLNGSSKSFAKGVQLQTWLGEAPQSALGVNLSSSESKDLSIYQPRYNATVSASNTPSQPWITSGSNTMYFSFDTPVNPTMVNGSPQYCGRAVFSDLHVGGDPTNNDGNSAPPNGCDPGPGELSPQEKALEFMLFDLSSCVIPDNVAPPDAGTALPPPPQ